MLTPKAVTGAGDENQQNMCLKASYRGEEQDPRHTVILDDFVPLASIPDCGHESYLLDVPLDRGPEGHHGGLRIVDCGTGSKSYNL
jgi:hypothetical protein